MTPNVEPHPIHTGIYQILLEDGNHSLATMNLIPSSSVYGERLYHINQQEFRLWNPYHSKLAAAVLRLPHHPGRRLQRRPHPRGRSFRACALHRPRSR